MSGVVEVSRQEPKHAPTISDRLVGLVDRLRWACWLRFNNGCEHMTRAYMAVDDSRDCLESIEAAIMDGDHCEALRLIDLSREALDGHISTLKGLL